MKKLNKYIIILFAAISSVFVTSCEKEIDLDLRTAAPRLVIEGKIQEYSYAKVKVSKTKGYYESNNFPNIEDAVITISNDQGEEETLQLAPDKEWYTGRSIIGTAGHTYYLNVSYEGKEYTSTSKMPPLVPIDSITFFNFPESVSSYPFPLVHFMDPPGKVNHYYRHIIYINGRRVKMNDPVTSPEERNELDGTYFHRVIPVFPENGSNDDPFEKGDLIEIEQYCIDKGAYKFFKDLEDIENSMVNPESNITGGSLGYFSAYSIDYQSIVAEW
ncbi:DUF4249 domain-containing protein [Dysgonomonas sp. 216]|uniref:DUF4249 domain-containing protein n=1 Tax=Dysgonomonas sp. 216 TaxID=2302934 RepID=UPI0013D2FD78|nr:DUF4249 domain-containing protein [Dysgonomonas sp. 216]NDW18614.1 DUF4249 domain-containing protein [Dysgonomonas sp. 216]